MRLVIPFASPLSCAACPVLRLALRMLSMYLVYVEDGLAAQGMSHVGEWPGLFSVNEVLPTLDGDPKSGAEWSTGPT